VRTGKIKGYKVGRQWRFQKQDIEGFLKGQQPRIDLPVSPDPLIRQLHAQLAAIGHKVARPEVPDDPISRPST